MAPIHVTLDDSKWPNFNVTDLQELFDKHMTGKKIKRGSGQADETRIYVVLGKNPVTFSITICPEHPCSP